jgi:hypothetical protein
MSGNTAWMTIETHTTVLLLEPNVRWHNAATCFSVQIWPLRNRFIFHEFLKDILIDIVRDFCRLVPITKTVSPATTTNPKLAAIERLFGV